MRGQTNICFRPFAGQNLRIEGTTAWVGRNPVHDMSLSRAGGQCRPLNGGKLLGDDAAQWILEPCASVPGEGGDTHAGGIGGPHQNAIPILWKPLGSLKCIHPAPRASFKVSMTGRVTIISKSNFARTLSGFLQGAILIVNKPLRMRLPVDERGHLSAAVIGCGSDRTVPNEACQRSIINLSSAAAFAMLVITTRPVLCIR